MFPESPGGVAAETEAMDTPHDMRSAQNTSTDSRPNASRRRPRVARAGTGVLAAVLSVYLVIRGAVELATVDPADAASYRQDWGGPSYLGVMLVHVGPGLLVLVLGAARLGRHRGLR